MKTEDKVREMMEAIKTGVKGGRINEVIGVSQVMILAWALDLLPPRAEAFQDSVLDPTGFSSAMAMQDMGLEESIAVSKKVWS